MKKVLIFNQPNFREVSQYNFSDDANVPFNYTSSTSLPENNDKFQSKDLQTTPYGSATNEYIIEHNLKYSGSSNVTIKELRIDNAGVNHDIENIQVRGWFFSRQFFISHPDNGNQTLPEDAGYGTLNNVLNDEESNPSRFYKQNFSDRSDGSNLGDITAVMGGPIVSNFEESGNIQVSSFENVNGGQFTVESDDSGFNSPLPTGLNTDSDNFLIDSVDENPLYFCFWMKGDADKWSGTDRREKRFQVYKIDNLQLFSGDGSGTAIEIDFPNGDADNRQDGGGGGSSWSAQAPAFIVRKFKVLIDTVSGTTNSNVTDDVAKEVSKDVTPSQDFFLSELNDINFLNNFNPLQQLNNNTLDGISQADTFPDFFPLTTINIDGDNQAIDLQSYYPFESQQSIRASAPATIKFSFNLVDVIEGTDVHTEKNIDYVYFVVRWDDINDEIKTVEDFLNDKPDNNVELLRRRQDENIYIPNIIEGGLNTTSNYLDYGEIKNVYNTPGIKTLKIIMVSFDKSSNQLGRWKLIKSRFYLDIPLNQYPDFGEVGGIDYTTIPWPFTTAVIGGVDVNSQYKQSVQNTLSSGKIGNVDIIDERFLINDIENDELGKSIKSMDLEQCRYFNKSFNMNNLLKINPIQDIGGGEFLGIIGIYSDGMFHYTLPSPFTDYNSIPNGYENMNYVLLELGISTYAAAAVFGGNGDPTEGDYQILPQVGTAIDSEGREWKTYDVITVIESVFKPFNDSYYDGETNKYPEETSVGQIFISDNQDIDLKQNCKLELNMGEITDKSILDTSGNSNKGLLIGDYKIKKFKKGDPMRRDSFIKVPKKTSNNRGAL